MKRLALLAVVLLAAGCGSTKTVTVTNTVTTTVTTTQAGLAACNGSDLSGTFDVQPGSAGAGQITYVLKLTNTSASACALKIISEQLLDAKGADMPTHGDVPVLPVRLGAQATLSFDARFSPDVNGVGDNTNGQCEPTSSTLRLAVGVDTVDVPIKPPTPVCEQGSLTLTPTRAP